MELPCLNTILVPIDGGESSRRAKRYAIALARKCGARVILFYAQDPVSPRISAEGRRKIEAKNLQYVDKIFEIYKDGFKRAGVEFETVVGHGAPAEAIIHAAREHGCGMIVMGAKGQYGAHKILGSVASRVSKHSTVPVFNVGAECDCANSCGDACRRKWNFVPVPSLQATQRV